jgi:Ca2+/H+ antiporter
MGQLVLLGIPLTAIGITLSSQGLALWVESVAATVMATGGLLVGISYAILGIKSRSQFYGIAWLAGGISLCCGMLLAFLYGWHLHLQLNWLTIPWMYAVHGSLNVLSLGMLLAGWRFFYR